MFYDVSERAYGAVIYIRYVTHSGLIKTKLLCSKSRVPPLKPLTVPRLELSTPLLLARLMHKSIPVLHLPLEIQSLCSNSQWRHVSSKNNPAVVLSRGADSRDLRDNDLWWQRLEFLVRDIPDPEECPCPKDKIFEKEL
ncbi:hypothetical protein AVEN_259567-1 [Araneus ventricosus]|uniref:Uncharacterized protein n=1 Tax=Araneus ventricosus TaxID=182803 RepID=A0A4Y2ENB3_ARAVE|nr:hypothetical protein AVEN_259567-1 [Araneus ventricosus]